MYFASHLSHIREARVYIRSRIGDVETPLTALTFQAAQDSIELGRSRSVTDYINWYQYNLYDIYTRDTSLLKRSFN